MFKKLLHRPLLQRIKFSFKNKNSLCISLNKTQNTKYNLAHALCFHTSAPARLVVSSHENNYAFSVVNKIPPKLLENSINESHEVDNLEEFNNMLLRNWRTASASAIVQAFRNVKNFSIQHNIDLSDKRFDNLIDGVVDNCEHLTVDEIITLLSCIGEMPVTESYHSHNFHDLWSCLDDICCYKMVNWDVDTSLEVGKLWYKLHIGKYNIYLIV